MLPRQGQVLRFRGCVELHFLDGTCATAQWPNGALHARVPIPGPHDGCTSHGYQCQHALSDCQRDRARFVFLVAAECGAACECRSEVIE